MGSCENAQKRHQAHLCMGALFSTAAMHCVHIAGVLSSVARACYESCSNRSAAVGLSSIVMLDKLSPCYLTAESATLQLLMQALQQQPTIHCASS
jgi:hypothetical protein